MEVTKVNCANCGITVLEHVAIEIYGKYYCCPDCAGDKKSCDCQ